MTDTECAAVLKTTRENARRAQFKRRYVFGTEATYDYLQRAEFIEALTHAIDVLEGRRALDSAKAVQPVSV